MMEYVLLMICVYLIVCPPKYDPAVRFKEWMESKKK